MSVLRFDPLKMRWRVPSPGADIGPALAGFGLRTRSRRSRHPRRREALAGIPLNMRRNTRKAHQSIGIALNDTVGVVATTASVVLREVIAGQGLMVAIVDPIDIAGLPGDAGSIGLL